VLAGDDFCGEIDRARSRHHKTNVNHGPSAPQLSSGPPSAAHGWRLEAQGRSKRLTFAASLTLLSLLQQLLFKLPGARLFLLVSSVVQLLY
jgi:hypothetical protein